jgi:hypothetical protein
VPPRLFSILTLGVACALAPAQSATIHLTHDDADGEVRPGDTVTWTLSVAFTGADAALSGNLRLIATAPNAAEASEFVFQPARYGPIEDNTVDGNGVPDGAGGFENLVWDNPLFYDFGYYNYDTSNPFVIGTFSTTTNWFGILDYELEPADPESAFLTLSRFLGLFTESFSREEVEFVVEPLRVGPSFPDDSGFDPSGSEEPCWEFGLNATGLGGGVDGAVHSMLELPNGDMVFGGMFGSSGGLPSPGIARWDGEAWHPFGDGIDGSVRALAMLPNGDLVAGGDFRAWDGVGDTNLARWDGESWTGLGEHFRMVVNDLAVLPNGDLIAGGASGGSTLWTYNGVARWDGNSWQALGGGTYSIFYVADLLVMPDGDLIAGGYFTSMGAIEVNRVARWDGTAWHKLSSGMSDVVRSLTLSPDGELVAGGEFEVAGGVVVHGVARWNGQAWAPFGSGPTGPGKRSGRANIQEIAYLPNGELIAAGDVVYGWNGIEWAEIYEVSGVRSLLSITDGTLFLGTNRGAFEWGANPRSPRVFRQPLSAEACPFGGTDFRVYSDGPDALTYRWQIADAGAPGGWRSLPNGSDPGLGSVSGAETYRLRVFGPTQDATLRCVVSNPCGDTVSDAAALVVDTAGCCDHIDFTADGVLDGADLAEFVTRYLGNDPTADLNGDFVLDLGDLQVFVYLYLSGCG